MSIQLGEFASVIPLAEGYMHNAAVKEPSDSQNLSDFEGA